jgi:isopenicillin N synthase-like dioxygenase
MTSTAALSSPSLPVLDLREFTEGDALQRERFVHTLREVAHGVGFFYLRGYGTALGQEEALFDVARAFFALPAERKQALQMVNSPHFRGYTGPGLEITRGAQDWREQVDFGAEYPAIAQGPGVPVWTRLQGPNQWPTDLPGLRTAVVAWQQALTVAGRQLLRALALALGQSEDRFDAAFATAPIQHVKLIRYPGRGADVSQQGVGAHKDSGCLTLLLQHREAGLQVLDRSVPGEAWIDVPPIEGTVVINLGEVLEVQSGGYLRANIHRVVSPPQSRERFSIAFFLSPQLDAELPPLPLPPELAARARGVDRDPRNPLIAHTGRNLLKGRLRSHPDVAERHYADVLEAEGIARGAPAGAYA